MKMLVKQVYFLQANPLITSAGYRHNKHIKVFRHNKVSVSC